MRKLIVTFALLLTPLALPAQTYTTSADGCGGKNLGYCTLPASSYAGNYKLVLDARNNSQGPINTLTITTPDFPATTLLTVHGTYAGFVANPDGTHNAYYSSGSFTSDDNTVNGQFTFYAYYVATCSGRGCAGTVVGWHFRVTSGSTVTVQ